MASLGKRNDTRRQSQVKFDDSPIVINGDRHQQDRVRRQQRTRDPRPLPPPISTRLRHPPYQKPLPGLPPEVTALDHIIGSHGGATSNLECLPHRLKVNKEVPPIGPIGSVRRIHELTRENGYLREELAMYKDVSRAVRELQERTRKAHQILHEALQDTTRKLARSERRLLDYWGINLDEASEEVAIF